MINEDMLIQLSQKMEPISSFVDVYTKKYKRSFANPGIYIFWFDNHDKIIENLKRELEVDGPDRINQKLIWNWNLDSEKVCLYVGKSTNMQKRLGLHLLLGTKKLYPNATSRLLKKTTSCQLRSGFEYLYQNYHGGSIFDEIHKRLFYTIIREDDFVSRFYMEDLLVGKLLPWFNVDSER
jgi:hypothetical protein